MRSRLILAGLFLLAGLASTGNETASARHASIRVASIVTRVAKVYGEPKPHILHLERTQTESSHEGMYVVKLWGHFRRHRVQAHYLYFSALSDRWYVWGVQAYDAHRRLRWLDATLPKHL